MQPGRDVGASSHASAPSESGEPNDSREPGRSSDRAAHQARATPGSAGTPGAGGDPLQAAAADLDELDQLAPAEQIGVFERVHRALSAALAGTADAGDQRR
ncbi:hypothetical protein [Nakamurella aerolata]|uniref:Uncharacterized protein n=1 Tax=Nakamurella aerolata TaxID=1656892 RepID=A0A849A994_9ACTN|nr:hypothetical protein [Nakamurella aerolata]NNG36186.1 hypothetical protein [Nakamurella aerolata]